MAKLVDKEVAVKLVGVDGNSFSLMAAWKNQARREKWTEQEINTVLDAAMKGNYDNLLYVLSEHSVNGGCGLDDDEESDDDDYICTGCPDWDDNEDEDEDSN